MSYQKFPATQYFKVFDTAEEVKMGSFTLASHLELKYIRVLFGMFGVASRAGSERIRTKIYSDTEHSKILYTSDWSSVTLANVSTLADSHSWTGWIRSEFSRYNLNKNITYYLSCQIDNYTRNADTYYCGLSHDFPHPIYDNSQNSFRYHPLAMQLFGYQERT